MNKSNVKILTKKSAPKQIKKREPKLMCACGTKGVGKTYATIQLIKEYIKENVKTGKKGRKVLIYDVNMEYEMFKAIDTKDVKRFSKSDKVEVRRVLPLNENGTSMNITEIVENMEHIIENFRGGMLVLEDVNRYMIGAKSVSVIGLLATNRHRDLDIICHFQSLSPLDPRMWQNTAVVRFHYQIDDVKRYKNRIPNYEMYAIAQSLVKMMYLEKKNKRFYVYVENEENKIKGKYTKKDFQDACSRYMEAHPNELNAKMKMVGKDKDLAIRKLTEELGMKYYAGI